MTASAPPADSLIDDLLLDWQEARDRGRPCPAEQLCAGHPEVLGEVRGRIAALEAMYALLCLDPSTPSDPGPPPSSAGPGGFPGLVGDLPRLPGYEVLALLDE